MHRHAGGITLGTTYAIRHAQSNPHFPFHTKFMEDGIHPAPEQDDLTSDIGGHKPQANRP